MWIVDRLLTWWNGQTLGTQLWTARHGTRVGEDEQGNVYYQTQGGKRRWVIYNGEAEASRVPPEWHGWLHFTFDQPPTEAPQVPVVYQLLKSVGHSTMALAEVVGPYVDNPDDKSWRGSMLAYRSRMQSALDGLDLEVRRTVRERSTKSSSHSSQDTA